MPIVDTIGARTLPCDESTSLAVVALHNFPEFTDQCCRLLNMEWPRSRGARMNILWACNRKFPVALILIKGETRDVLGFCKLSKVPTEPSACFVESVVIHPENRGKGLGSYLMKKVEHYVCSRKMSMLYLSTVGQESFYQKLGYEECGPVSLYGLGNKIGYKIEQLTTKNSTLHEPNVREEAVLPLFPSSALDGQGENQIRISEAKLNSSVPPPPPPPIKLHSQEVMAKKTFMRKTLTYPCNHGHFETRHVQS